MDTKGRRNSTITWSAEQQMYVTTDLLGLDMVRKKELSNLGIKTIDDLSLLGRLK